LVVDEYRPPVLFPRDGPTSHLPPMLSEQLTRIGFYRDLPYGDRDGRSLHDAVGGLAAEDLGIASYLRGGASIGSLPESPVDVLDPKSTDREPVYVLTDGRFKWSSQLAYYVERHRVRLPAGLLNQARNVDWTCPTPDRAAAWRLQIDRDWDYGGPAAVVFDALAPTYDRHGEQSRLARQLLDAMGTIEGNVVDVACGTGQVAAALPDTVASILAVDASAGMVTHGRACKDAPRVRWRTAPALPLPVADGSIDVIICASALHLLGRAALRDWQRAMRPGGRVGYTLPLPSRWKPSPQIAALQASDIELPANHAQAIRLAESAGLVDIAVTVRDEQIVTTARTPHQNHSG
jgi:SAM-dependent methyltransferase